MDLSQTIDLLRSADSTLCLSTNRLTHRKVIGILDATSRLGDGVHRPLPSAKPGTGSIPS